MKRFTALLVAGLIATCTARLIDSAKNEHDGSVSSEESAETKELLQEVETACHAKTGSSEAYEAVVATYDVIPLCFFLLINGTEFKNDLERLKANASVRHEFFPKYCPQFRDAIQCLEPLTVELGKCLDVDDALILNGTYDAVPEALDVICENDGEIVFDEGATYEVCIDNLSNYTDECNELLSNSTNIIEVSKFGEEQCREMVQVRDCMQGKFNECNGPRLMDVFDVFWRAVLKHIPCGNLINGPKETGDDKAH